MKTLYKHSKKRKIWISSYNKEYHETHKQEIKESKKKPHRRYWFTKHKAKERGLEFNLTKEFYIQNVIKPCSYCGGSNINSIGTGLDRIDNSKGYILGNVIPCCGICNKIRGCFLTVAEMKVAMKAILQYRAKLL